MFRGGCEKRGVAMCDIVFITSPHWDASNGVAHTFDSVDDGPYPLCWECVAVRISSQLISISDLYNMMRTARCSTVGRNHFRGRKSNFSVSVLKKSSISGVIKETLFVNSEDS